MRIVSANSPSLEDELSQHRSASIEFVRSSGGFAVRTPKGQKDPGSNRWDPKTNSLEKSEKLLYELASSTDNIGMHFFGDLVDVDVDGYSEILVAALDHFLPKSMHVWGRTSKPRTHRAYLLNTSGMGDFDPSNYPFLRRMKSIPEASVEIRGGAKSRGTYSMLPGSTHPEGEPYLWADLRTVSSTVSVVTLPRLFEAIRKAGAVAVLSQVWTPGIRNDLCMALSGFLCKAAKLVDVVPDGGFVLDRAAARSFVQSFLALSNDDDADIRSRLKTFDMTWDKGEKGGKIQGGKSIEELTGDKTILRKLYTLLCDAPEAEQIEAFTERFAIWQGAGMVIDLDNLGSERAHPVMRRDAFVNSWANHKVSIGGKSVRLVDILFDLPQALRVAGFMFDPSSPTQVEHDNKVWINQWSGFEIKPCAEEVSTKEVEPFLSYLYNIVANCNEEIYNWVLAWCADIFQNPGDKIGTALVLVGLPGAGKSILGEAILRKIIGSNHATVADQLEHLVTGFNSEFSHKLLVQCDEAINSRQKLVASRLAAIVTDKMMRIEQKNVPAHKIENHMRLLFTSNEVNDAIAILHGEADRRYTVVHVSDKYAAAPNGVPPDAKLKYWSTLRKWLEDPEVLSKIHRYLLQLRYDRETIRRPLATEAKRVMQRGSWEIFDSWLGAALARNHPLSIDHHKRSVDSWVHGQTNVINREDWPTHVNYTALVSDFEAFRKANGVRLGPVDEARLGQFLKARRLVGNEIDSKFLRYEAYDPRTNEKIRGKIRVRQFPSREQIEDFLSVRYGYEKSLFFSDEEVVTTPETPDEEDY